MLKRRSCPACGTIKIKPNYAVRPQHLLKCQRCGLVFEARSPTDHELASHYGQYSYSRIKSCPPATQASYREVLSTLAPWRGHGRLLDFGCGQGDFLVEAAAAHWQPTGMEFSEDAVTLCHQRGLSVTQGARAVTAFAGGCFDVVTAFEVLEHLRNPGDLFQDAACLLEPGGLLYITTPNYNSLLRFLERDRFAMVAYPDHLCLFTSGSLRRLAARHNFRIATLRTSGLDPYRLMRALRPSPLQQTTDSVSPSSTIAHRNALREASYAHPHAALLKASVNALVNAIGAGDTLKVWLVKM
jgi:SAM-dependent methyltransferase